jgi:transcription termination factor NusB
VSGTFSRKIRILFEWTIELFAWQLFLESQFTFVLCRLLILWFFSLQNRGQEFGKNFHFSFFLPWLRHQHFMSSHWQESRERSLFQERCFLNSSRELHWSRHQCLIVSHSGYSDDWKMMMCWENWKEEEKKNSSFLKQQTLKTCKKREKLFFIISSSVSWVTQTERLSHSVQSVLQMKTHSCHFHSFRLFLLETFNSLSFVSNCASFASCVSLVLCLLRILNEWKWKGKTKQRERMKASS